MTPSLFKYSNVFHVHAPAMSVQEGKLGKNAFDLLCNSETYKGKMPNLMDNKI